MRSVMAALLGEEGFAGWEASLDDRREEEDQQREYSEICSCMRRCWRPFYELST